VPERLSADIFQPLIGTAFVVSDEADGRVELTLSSVVTRDQAVPDAPEGWVAFTLQFEGPREPLVPQGTYRFRHAATGGIDIFIVPIAQNETATIYEAVFG
jgi:hypothetical protein